MILSLILGLIFSWFIDRKITFSRYKIKGFYIFIINPILLISLLSTFIIIGNFYIPISYYTIRLPLSYPLEFMHSVDNMPSDPTRMVFYIKFFGINIFSFDKYVYNSLEITPVLLCWGFYFFCQNYLSTVLLLSSIRKASKVRMLLKNLFIKPS